MAWGTSETPYSKMDGLKGGVWVKQDLRTPSKGSFEPVQTSR